MDDISGEDIHSNLIESSKCEYRRIANLCRELSP